MLDAALHKLLYWFYKMLEVLMRGIAAVLVLVGITLIIGLIVMFGLAVLVTIKHLLEQL